MEVIIYDCEGNPLVQKRIYPDSGNDAVEISLDTSGITLEGNL